MVKNIKSLNKLNSFTISIIIVIVIITFIALYLHFRRNKLESFDSESKNDELIVKKILFNFADYKNDIFITYVIFNKNIITYCDDVKKLIYPNNKVKNINKCDSVYIT